MSGERTGHDVYDDPQAIGILARHWHDLVGPVVRGTTHWDGCETEHKNCALWLFTRHILHRTRGGE